MRGRPPKSTRTYTLVPDTRLFRSHAHFQEMALHDDPGPPGSDSHFLVVIAMAAAAREGIAQPEVLLQRNGIGEIGKARRPLVRRNDEIRVSAVMNSHTLRVHDQIGRAHV